MDIERPRSAAQQRILDTPLSALAPPEALTVAPNESVGEVMRKMRAGGLGSALIVDHGTVTGIFTERDALMKLTGRTVDFRKTPVETVMTRDPRVLRDEDTLALALHFMAIGSYRTSRSPATGSRHGLSRFAACCATLASTPGSRAGQALRRAAIWSSRSRG